MKLLFSTFDQILFQDNRTHQIRRTRLGSPCRTFGSGIAHLFVTTFEVPEEYTRRERRLIMSAAGDCCMDLYPGILIHQMNGLYFERQKVRGRCLADVVCRGRRHRRHRSISKARKAYQRQGASKVYLGLAKRKGTDRRNLSRDWPTYSAQLAAQVQEQAEEFFIVRRPCFRKTHMRKGIERRLYPVFDLRTLTFGVVGRHQATR
jgi:hypothetical protein